MFLIKIASKISPQHATLTRGRAVKRGYCSAKSRDFVKNLHKKNAAIDKKNKAATSTLRQKFEDFGVGSTFSGQTESAIDQIAEKKMQAWLKSDDSKNLKGKGKPRRTDPHQAAAHQVGLDQATMKMTKIMADNKVLPASIQRKKDIAHEWENIIKINIQKDFELVEKENESINDKEKIFQIFISKKDILVKYRKQFEVLNKKVKRANNALISDSLLFSRGMHVANTPVRAFVYEEKMREAVFGAP